jgi:hypothetical protein
MRSSIVVACLLVSRVALAGPSVWPQLVCRDQVGVVTVVAIDGTRAQLRLDDDFGLLGHSCPPAAHYGGFDVGYNPEGCYLEPARISAPKGDLAIGDRFAAELEPPAGAQCATSATATHLVPIEWLAMLGALL